MLCDSVSVLPIFVAEGRRCIRSSEASSNRPRLAPLAARRLDSSSIVCLARLSVAFLALGLSERSAAHPIPHLRRPPFDALRVHAPQSFRFANSSHGVPTGRSPQIRLG